MKENTKEYIIKLFWIFIIVSIIAVSYTHLDVYKRQILGCIKFPPFATADTAVII